LLITMLNVIMLSIVGLNVIMLSIVGLNVVMLNVIMLNVIMLNVVSPNTTLVKCFQPSLNLAARPKLKDRLLDLSGNIRLGRKSLTRTDTPSYLALSGAIKKFNGIDTYKFRKLFYSHFLSKTWPPLYFFIFNFKGSLFKILLSLAFLSFSVFLFLH
jgi:hypothetical protein